MIVAIESYDVNTVRAAIPMYLLAKWIAENTKYKVILSGEGADELFLSYNYGRLAKNSEAAAQECKRLIRNLHQFDLLRAERCFAAHGLELRVPFLDQKVVKYLLGIDGKYKFFRDGEEKWLLRDSFRMCDGFEPLKQSRVIERQKERMSDGVGFSWVPRLIENAEKTIHNEELSGLDTLYPYRTPKSKEELLYRRIFERYYPGQARVIMERVLPEWATLPKEETEDNGMGNSLQ